jgi:phenylalanine ammonia-lyase
LAYIFGAIEGNPDIAMNCREGQNHRIIPAIQALQEARLTPLEFGPKEGLGPLDGTAFSCGAATLVLFEANRLAIFVAVAHRDGDRGFARITIQLSSVHRRGST